MKKKVIDYVFKEGDTLVGVVKGKSSFILTNEQINNILEEIFIINNKNYFKSGESIKLIIYTD